MGKLRLLIILAVTALYWFWESHAEGNIRIDLLVIFPLLALFYLWALWKWLKWQAFIVCFILMGLNYMFMTASYELFNKFPG